MKITNSGKVVYEGSSEGVYVYRFSKDSVERGDYDKTIEVHECVLLDFNKDGRLIGVEVLPSNEDLTAALNKKGRIFGSQLRWARDTIRNLRK